ncbi:hypothetical protein GCM10011491_23560 [Brucella endophytica]|uniref:DUF1612 domain-containing protein n=1 Tax=Brucella endophytica TaxID=1963359 RepID=A0A916SG20_9HYPH|nr:RHE_PE00001 family protein [Brucella endophytica]GGA94565.1 hypothetical protein GCM10011491_23560 [Brucella endophytica]
MVTRYGEDAVRSIPWADIASPLVAAEEAVARLDERLARSPVRSGLIERFHFHDAVAALWLEGELVQLEDLVLHDAHMDIRTPTHELTRAHAVLRARRQISTRRPDWALGRKGVRQLSGGGALDVTMGGGEEGEGAVGVAAGLDAAALDTEDKLAAEFAAIDAVLARASAVLDGATVARPTAPLPRDPLIFDPEWDEAARLDDWRAVLDRSADLPPVLAAAILWDVWEEIGPLQRRGWLGTLLIEALLRQRGKTKTHLLALNSGLRAIARDRRRHRDRTTRLKAFLAAVSEAAALGLKEHDRLTLAHEQMQRRTGNRRQNSRLPQFVDFVLARPLVSSAMIEKELEISTRGALNLVGELGLREITGRGRYRAWAIM